MQSAIAQSHGKDTRIRLNEMNISETTSRKSLCENSPDGVWQILTIKSADAVCRIPFFGRTMPLAVR
jgi:hypothetical protein